MIFHVIENIGAFMGHAPDVLARLALRWWLVLLIGVVAAIPAAGCGLVDALLSRP